MRLLLDALLRAALGFYFRRMELSGEVPRSGPLLVCANHPNSLMDAMVVAALLPRRVHIVATATLFKLPPVAALLRGLGVIPINRASDDPRGMRSVAATFESVYRVLDEGGAVLIFPEGITYDEPALREVKSGAARMALEFVHGRGKDLILLPLGLAYPSRARYRGDAFASAGAALPARAYLDGYPERKKDCVTRLGEALDAALKGLVVHQPDAERARVTEGVLRLSGAERDPAARKRAADAVEAFYEERPAEAAGFAARLSRYESLLERAAVDDAAVKAWEGEGLGRRESMARGLAAVVLAPAALWGAAHRWLPLKLTAMAVERFADKERLQARIGTRALLAAVPAFALFYGALIAAVHRLLGWPASLWYGLSLPVTGLLAHAYQAELERLWGHAGRLWRLGRLKRTASLLSRLRAGLVGEIPALTDAGPKANL